jgi:hypothetical protein
MARWGRRCFEPLTHLVRNAFELAPLAGPLGVVSSLEEYRLRSGTP